MTIADNPKPYLRELIGKPVVVRLKWGHTEYQGQLLSTDSYMNLQLKNVEEIIDGVNNGTLNEIFIRCNNVMWVAPGCS